MSEIIKSRIKELYANNSFMNLCEIKIIALACGQITVGLSLKAEKHGNLNGMAHGGLIATLSDNATGVVGASVGKKVVTSTLVLDYIKGAPLGSYIEANATITHMDEKLMTINIDVCLPETSTLVAKVSAAMIIVDTFPGIPEKW